MRRLLLSVLGGLGSLLAFGGILLVLVAGDEKSGAPRAATKASPLAGKAGVLKAYGRLPLRFEPNRGQSDERVRFTARAPGSTVLLTSTGATLALGGRSANGREGGRSGSTAVVGLRVVGADRGAKVSGVDRQAGMSNYLTGSDRRRWRTGVPGYGRVSYREVSPGIDLAFYGRQRKLEYDFIVAPRADVGRIGLELSGAKGVRVDRAGDLVVDTAAGPLRQRAPVIYQRVGGRKRSVSGGYVLEGNGRVGFRVGRYDRSRELVIDPVLDYGTYLGGSFSRDELTAIGVDPSCTSSCSAYVTGTTDVGSNTNPINFPLKNALQGTFGGGGDAFVAKLNGDGSALEYATYLGGSSFDNSSSIAVDSSGRAFVSGSTSSGGGPAPETAFPTTPGAFQGALGGGTDAFLAVLKPDGSGLDYSTFLGGASSESGSVAVQGGKAYVAGFTASPAFPTSSGAFDTTCGTAADPCDESSSKFDAFAVKLDPGASGRVAGLLDLRGRDRQRRRDRRGGRDWGRLPDRRYQLGGLPGDRRSVPDHAVGRQRRLRGQAQARRLGP